MKQIIKHGIGRAVTVSLLLSAGLASAADFGEQSLARGAVADVTPQQKYQSAIREAGGAYKEWLRECMRFNGEDQRSCRREAKAVYDRDMAEARMILQGR